MLPLNRLSFNSSLQSLSVTITPPDKNQNRCPQLGLRIGIISQLMDNIRSLQQGENFHIIYFHKYICKQHCAQNVNLFCKNLKKVNQIRKVYGLDNFKNCIPRSSIHLMTLI